MESLMSRSYSSASTDLRPSGEQCPLVSVVLLSYDRPNFLEESLDPLDRQSFKHVQIIVVDNKSNTSGEIAEIVRLFPNIRLVANSHNLGFTGGMNRGLREASGEYVYLTEDDLVVEENCILRLVEHMQNNASIGL